MNDVPPRQNKWGAMSDEERLKNPYLHPQQPTIPSSQTPASPPVQQVPQEPYYPSPQQPASWNDTPPQGQYVPQPYGQPQAPFDSAYPWAEPVAPNSGPRSKVAVTGFCLTLVPYVTWVFAGILSTLAGTASYDVLTIILGFLGLLSVPATIAGIVCCHVSFRGIKKYGFKGRGFATAGLILGYFTVASFLVLIAAFMAILGFIGVVTG